LLPKPPFDCDLTHERELEEFQRLKPKLASVWGMLTANEGQPSTSVVVPSLTLDAEELTKLAGASITRSGCCSCSSGCGTHALTWCT
jgi:hypothetical protein